jgi:membrane protein YdbS with pleckstrin-like domain
MKLFVFLGLILASIYGSLILGLNDIKNNKKPMNAIIKAIFVNVIILGIGSVWWILTESDGISQGTGIMIYLGSIVVISLIDTIVIYSRRKFKKQVS